MEDLRTDWFSWLMEGVLILIVGCIGLLGNSFSLVLFSRKKKHKIFHNLLLTLTIFDMIYVLCSILLFSISKFSFKYETVYKLHILPYLLPVAHIGLTGSVYCTVSMTIERFLAVYYPFLRYSGRAYATRTFILPVICFTLIYNIPKFFELHVIDDCHITSSSNCSLIIQPTELRTHRIYIRIYILWMNLLVQFVVPFVLLITLNIKIYQKIRQFEQNLSSNIRVFSCNSKRQQQQNLQSNHHPAVAASPSSNVSTIQEAAVSNVPAATDQMQIAGSSRVVSLRRREVTFARISLYIVFVFLVCHGVRLFPNIFEVMQTYTEDYDELKNDDFPAWMHGVTSLSHFLLAFACSANFFIYFAKHGQICRSSGDGSVTGDRGGRIWNKRDVKEEEEEEEEEKLQQTKCTQVNEQTSV